MNIELIAFSIAGWLVGEDVRARACRLDCIRVLGNSAFRITPQLFELANCYRASVKWLRFGTGSRTRTRNKVRVGIKWRMTTAP
jgi:hypothetical protein